MLNIKKEQKSYMCEQSRYKHIQNPRMRPVWILYKDLWHEFIVINIDIKLDINWL